MSSGSSSHKAGGGQVPPVGNSGADSTEQTPPAVRPPGDDQPTVISHRPPMLPAPGDVQQEPSQWADPAPGMQLGHFRLLELVGGGGMGRVFRAWDIRLDRPVALKVLARQQATDRDTVQRFHNEGRSAARLNHDGIARVFYLGEEQGLPFIAFEFVEGTNIRDMVGQRGPLPLPEALHYTIQVAEAIAHAAAHHVVHRDIKPSNIIVTDQGHTKLIDLGLARLRAAPGQDDLTATGVTLGTFDYIAPEQARDPRNADELSDIYSLGCTFFFMLTGQPPYPEGTVLQKLLQHQGDEPPDVRRFRPELPVEVALVLRKMMAKDRRRRYQSAQELTAALRGLAELVGVGPSGWRPGDSAPSSQRLRHLVNRHGPWLSAVAGLLVAVVLLRTLWTPPAAERNLVPPGWTAMSENAELPAASPGTGGGNPTEADSTIGEESAPGTRAERGATPGAHSAGETQSSTSDSRGDTSSAGKPASPEAGTAGNAPPASSDERAVSPAGTDSILLAPPELTGGLALGNETSLLGPAALLRSGRAGVSAAPGASDSAASGSRSVPAAGRKPLVVGEGRADETTFATLKDACQAASDGDVIELRFSGLRRQDTIALDRVRLTIRAGEGYSPVLAIRAPQPDATAETARPTGESLFALQDADLVLENLTLQLGRPSGSAASRRELLRLTGDCRLTIRTCWLMLDGNGPPATSGDSVAAVRVLARPATAIAVPPAVSGSRTQIVLNNTVCRGRGSFLCLQGVATVSCQWDNGLVAVSHSLFSARDGAQPVLPEASVRLESNRLTVLVGGPLCQLHGSPDRSFQLPVYLRSSGCLFVGSGRLPLIEQVDAAGSPAATVPITWTGQDNVIAGFGDFYSVRDPSSNIPRQVKTFDDWQLLVGNTPAEGPQPLPEQWSELMQSADRFSTLTPADLAPLQVAWQAAEQAGATTRGFVLDKLPAPPPKDEPQP